MGQRDTPKRGYRRSRDKKRVISASLRSPRAKRKPVVIRASLGARSPHYSWFIQTCAARFYYFLVTSQGRTEYSSFPFVPRYYCYDYCFHPLHLRARARETPSPFSLPLSLSVFSLCASLFFRLVRCRVGVRGTLLKNYTSKPL